MAHAERTPQATGLHEVLAREWCKWIGQRGTAKQIASVMRRLNVETLTRMLAARGIRFEVVELR